MHAYEVGYGSYEDSGYIQLFHEQHFSVEEFEALILDVAPEAASRALERNQSYEDDVQYGDYYWGHGFEYIYKHVADLLVERHGFQRIEYAARYSLFGWPNVLDKSDWGSDRDDALDRLADRLREAGFTPEKYPTHKDRPYRAWSDLAENTRARWAEMGYDEGSFNDAWNEAIPEEDKRKPRRRMGRKRPRHASPSLKDALPGEEE